mgnify:FL=1
MTNQKIELEEERAKVQQEADTLSSANNTKASELKLIKSQHAELAQKTAQEQARLQSALITQEADLIKTREEMTEVIQSKSKLESALGEAIAELEMYTLQKQDLERGIEEEQQRNNAAESEVTKLADLEPQVVTLQEEIERLCDEASDAATREVLLTSKVEKHSAELSKLEQERLSLGRAL